MNFNKWKKAISTVGLAVGLALGAGSAQSAVNYSFEDDDVDFIVRNVGGVLTPQTSGAIAVGDIFVSVLTLNSFFIGGASAIPANQQMTGVAAVQLLAIVPAGGGNSTFVFGAYTGGLNSILALGGGPVDANVGAPGNPGGGAVVAMYLNSTTGAGGDINLDLSRTTAPGTNCGATLSGCIDQGSRGTLFQLDGFRGDPDESWTANVTGAGLNIGTVLNTSNNINVAAVNPQISNFFQLGGTIEWINIATGLPCGNAGYVADGCVQVSVSASIQGGQGLGAVAGNEAFAHSDFDGQKWAAPEPGTLALLGLGLAGVGFGTSRRKKVAA